MRLCVSWGHERSWYEFTLAAVRESSPGSQQIKNPRNNSHKNAYDQTSIRLINFEANDSEYEANRDELFAGNTRGILEYFRVTRKHFF